MRFKTDENLPAEAAELLAAAGHDVETVHQERLSGGPDEAIAAACQRERRTLVTLDRDFADIRTYRPHDYAGIIVLRPSRHDKRRVLALIERLIPLFDRQSPDCRLWIVDETTVRIRA